MSFFNTKQMLRNKNTKNRNIKIKNRNFYIKYRAKQIILP